MTPDQLAAAIVRVALLPPSEWTAEDRYIIHTQTERDGGKEVENWLLQGRARAMLAKIVGRLLDSGLTAGLTTPTDEESLEFATSK